MFLHLDFVLFNMHGKFLVINNKRLKVEYIKVKERKKLKKKKIKNIKYKNGKRKEKWHKYIKNQMDYIYNFLNQPHWI